MKFIDDRKPGGRAVKVGEKAIVCSRGRREGNKARAQNILY